MHHDLGPLGTAVNPAALRRQVRMLTTMGCNALRTSHNPPSQVLLDLCDEMGLYVIDEAFDEWRIGKVQNGYHTLFDSWAERDLRALIRRDRNHPSVVMWSIGNEVRDQGSPEGAEVAKKLVDICHDEDPTRPTTAGFNDSDDAIRHGLAEAVDVPGWNYRPTDYARYRSEHPTWPMCGTETASCISSRGEYRLPGDEEKPPFQDNFQVNSFDLCTPPWATTPDQEFTGLDENPTIMGEFVWTGFDYLGEPTPYYGEWPSRSSYFGIVDLAGNPKSRYWLYRSRWTREPVLYVHPHWNWAEGDSVPVHCYSNAPVVELFLNGRSLGRKSRSERTLLNRHRLVWTVPFEPGTLKAVSISEEGDVIQETSRQTAGAATGVRLESDRSAFSADGEDMVFVTATVVDADGIPAPRADQRIEFQVEGALLAGLCNGDPTSVEPFTGRSMKAFHGVCVAYIRAGHNPGTARITASAEGLRSDSIGVSAE